VIRKLIVVLDVVAAVIVGAVLAFSTAILLIGAQVRGMETTVNGWSTTMTCGKAGNGVLVRAACAQAFFAVNLPEEAVYWTATEDGEGQTLTGRHGYVLQFPAGDLPPNHAFWSLTMTIAPGYLVANPSHRYSVGDRSGLVANPDGSIDIYIQTAAPAGHEANWLPAPNGDFKLWFRVYQPDRAILNGAYHPPPVMEVH
jgi:hypothetical protein